MSFILLNWTLLLVRVVRVVLPRDRSKEVLTLDLRDLALIYGG